MKEGQPDQQYPLVKTTKQITIISLIALVIGHLMITSYVPNPMVNVVGLLITTYYIYQKTLKKEDVFSFIMVMYFCSTFPFLLQKGGGYNLVAFASTLMYFIGHRKLPSERRIADPWINGLFFLLILSSILGWLINYTGSLTDLLYSIASFWGVISMLLIASKLAITPERIKIFLQINIILIIFSTIACLNVLFPFFPFPTPLMPVYGYVSSTMFSAGGIIGVGPLHGEYSMVLYILFITFYFFNSHKSFISNKILIIATVLAILNVLVSVTRSVFILSLFGTLLLFILQGRVLQVTAIKSLTVIGGIIVITLLLFIVSITSTMMDTMLGRLNQIKQENKDAGGITLERIFNGSAFNRDTAFELSFKRLQSKDTWIVGYGWGVGENNRDAFYTDPSIVRGSAHSQIFAILFIFGWLGFIAYWALLIRVILKLYKSMKNHRLAIIQRIFAMFMFIALIAFVLDEIKADSISWPTYFSVTIIWLGLAIATNNKPVIHSA